jgi:hypothetical protein
VRRIVGAALALVGAFMLAAAILAQFYAADRLMKTPIDANTTTDLSGTAQLTNGTELVELPVKAWSINKSDSEKSDDDVAVFVSSSCLVKDEGDIAECVSADDPQDRLLSATTDNFATDRRTALAINDPRYLPADATEHEGVVNKWPFEAEKKTYPYWDGLVGEAVDAVYDRTEELFGVDAYVYKVTINEAPIELSEGVPGTYTDEKEIYVHPFTGSILKQVDHQERADDEGNPALILDLAFTDDAVATKVDEAKDNTDSLNLVRETIPLIGYLVGIPLLLIGLALLVLSYRSKGQRAA